MGLFGVFLSLILIVYLVRKKINVGWAMVLGAVVVSIFSSMGIESFFQALKAAVISKTFINLAAVVFLISLLGYIMKLTGALDLMITSLLSLFGGGRFLMISIPSLIGLLTVPGGAILSAPMVGESGDKLGLTKDQKAAVNIFFRHIWFPIYPLSPAMLLAASLTGVKVSKIILICLPVVTIAATAAIKTMFVGAKKIERQKDVDKTLAVIRLLQSMLPMIVTLALALIFNLHFPLSVLIGIAMALFNLLDTNKGIKEQLIYRFKTMVIPGINFSMVISVFGIIVFKEVLEASSVLSNFMEYMISLGLPIALLGFSSALFTGLITGSNTASLGITVPIFLPFILATNPLPYVLLIFIASLIGYVLSPLHLCLILTKEHFNCDYKGFYQYFYWPVGLMILGTVTMAFVMIYFN